jgi:hypothetical protein
MPDPIPPGEPDEPDLSQLLSASVPAFAVAAVVSDAERPDLGEVAVLAIVPTLTIHTTTQPGQASVDLFVSSLLSKGLALAGSFTPAALLELPTPQGWRLSVVDDSTVSITEPDGVLYFGQLGAHLPPGWHAALARHHRLVLLMASNLGSGETVRAFLDSARRQGNVVGASLVPQT